MTTSFGADARHRRPLYPCDERASVEFDSLDRRGWTIHYRWRVGSIGGVQAARCTCASHRPRKARHADRMTSEVHAASVHDLGSLSDAELDQLEAQVRGVAGAAGGLSEMLDALVEEVRAARHTARLGAARAARQPLDRPRRRHPRPARGDGTGNRVARGSEPQSDASGRLGGRRRAAGPRTARGEGFTRRAEAKRSRGGRPDGRGAEGRGNSSRPRQESRRSVCAKWRRRGAGRHFGTCRARAMATRAHDACHGEPASPDAPFDRHDRRARERAGHGRRNRGRLEHPPAARCDAAEPARSRACRGAAGHRVSLTRRSTRSVTTGRGIVQPMPTRQEVVTAAGHEVTITNPDKIFFPRTGHTKLVARPLLHGGRRRRASRHRRPADGAEALRERR